MSTNEPPSGIDAGTGAAHEAVAYRRLHALMSTPHAPAPASTPQEPS